MGFVGQPGLTPFASARREKLPRLSSRLEWHFLSVLPWTTETENAREPFIIERRGTMAAWDDVIDFDNIGEWPMELTGMAEPAQRARPADEEQKLRVAHLVRGFSERSKIKAFHCTRLLPSEVEAIRDGD